MRSVSARGVPYGPLPGGDTGLSLAGVMVCAGHPAGRGRREPTPDPYGDDTIDAAGSRRYPNSAARRVSPFTTFFR